MDQTSLINEHLRKIDATAEALGLKPKERFLLLELEMATISYYQDAPEDGAEEASREAFTGALSVQLSPRIQRHKATLAADAAARVARLDGFACANGGGDVVMACREALTRELRAAYDAF